MHGGRSTGPRTAAGRQRNAAAQTTHGWWTHEGRAFRHAITQLVADARLLRHLVLAARHQRQNTAAAIALPQQTPQKRKGPANAGPFS
jgi:hypothetical protein